MEKKKPEYLKIYETLRQDMVAGLYSYGQKLPSKRVLADRFGVSVVTAEHAYDLLAEEGYLTARERSGYFVSYRETDSFAPAAEVPHPVTPPKEKAPDSFPFSVYSRAVRRVLTEYGDAVLQKSPNCGLMELRQALSRYLSRSRHMNVSPEQIIIGAGAEYLYGLILRLLGRDKIYGLEDPSYEKIREVYRTDSVQCRLLPLGKQGIESAALWQTDAAVLHISPYRSFPSGVTASAAKKREYLRWAEQKNGTIIEDDFESEFNPSAKPTETVFSLDTEGRVVYLNTFTRTIAPSLRVGYMVLPPKLLGEFRQRLEFYSCTVPTVSQYVLASLLEEGDFERHLNRIRRKNRKK